MKDSEEFVKSVALPKWPQCFITGTKISPEDALEIIRRTDIYFCWPSSGHSNCKEYSDWINSTLQIPLLTDSGTTLSAEEKLKIIQKYDEEVHAWKTNWRCIDLNYLYNDYVMSSSACGCTGWCHPDGNIEYHHNIGKWPSVSEVYDDLKEIASNFPFLEMECTLKNTDDRCGNNDPLISYLVRNGQVEIVDPGERNIHEEFHKNLITDNKEVEDIEEQQWNDIMYRLITYGFTSNISRDVILSWRKYLKYE